MSYFAGQISLLTPSQYLSHLRYCTLFVNKECKINEKQMNKECETFGKY